MAGRYGRRAAALAALLVCGLAACAGEARPLSAEDIGKALPTDGSLPDGWALRHEPSTEDPLWAENTCRTFTGTKCPGIRAMGGAGVEDPRHRKTGSGSYAGINILSFDTAEQVQAALEAKVGDFDLDLPLELETSADRTVATHRYTPLVGYSSRVALRIGPNFAYVAGNVVAPEDLNGLAQHVAERIREHSGG
ncbi:hypothetical protein [Streptomyces sp. NPDC090029]|uniref:hypothetical protein n=1 Tax=Streptomyces sp. NPDC090029 TaxID=3365924 RepID=UPI0037FF3550